MREILISESAWEEMTCLFAPSLVLNTGDARNLTFPDSGIIMGTKDVRHAYEMLPEAKIITVHMDAVNHTTVSRADMRAYIKENKLDDRVVVPNDGETVKY
ncbi:hypothetical protein [Enterobacter hormaechei]|uniref:hypothetical protein n=1 Tax=Enterobacter hormaechei TaxID=158836 RepID=UPI003EBADC8A